MDHHRNRRKKEPNLAFIDEETPPVENRISSRDDGKDSGNDEKMDVSSAFASRPVSADDCGDDDELDVDSSPLWQQAEDQGWELTWPIWHMLPRHERKELALKHGYNTIGEFEEYMSLQQAEQQSQRQQQPYPNRSIYAPRGITSPAIAVSSSKEKSESTAQVGGLKAGDDDSEDEEEEAHVDEIKANRLLMQRKSSSMSTSSDSADDEVADETVDANDDAGLSMEELLALGGQILMLPEELLQQIFDWLPVDAYGILALVSPHWKHLTRTESVYQRLCERLYLNQSKKRQLHVHKFGNSYRNMLLHRPRVRAAGGCYVLKYNKVKRIQRDMWTEVCFVCRICTCAVAATFLFRAM